MRIYLNTVAHATDCNLAGGIGFVTSAMLSRSLLLCMQLAERRKGNVKYKAGNLDGAMHHYERALAIVDYVRGMSAAEQARHSSTVQHISTHTTVCCL